MIFRHYFEYTGEDFWTRYINSYWNVHFETTTLLICGLRRPGYVIEINKDERFVTTKTYNLTVTSQQKYELTQLKW